MTVNIITATFKARDIIAEQVSPVPGTDIIEVLANAIVADSKGELFGELTLAEVTDLVITVARQRTEEGDE